ncbi:NAD(P)H-binding protein [Streptomyces sp. SL13]|uniref:NAD(P)H-binding protein n=1 Tax=Streptantibioticus silvisoli TaxID=2705255 RepID=A0AA90H627_9ACTN|nr:NAD(P)H-binding protein [Streptantibioticus silvisoli]MDI5969485.1 NAD(P)H-binding protein [Streptantibioticus silvisoli]
MIVVTGASGHVGRALVDRLLAQGAPVRAVTRDPDKAGLPAAAGTYRADLAADDPGPLFDGADALFVNLAAGGAPTCVRLVEAAAAAGVPRAVLLSSAGVTGTAEDADNAIAHMHSVVEQAVVASGMRWTFVRGGMFATNTLDWAGQIHASGAVRGPNATSVSAPVHQDDLAAVAAAALLDDTGTHDGAVHHVTGPEALTPPQMLDIIGHAIGRHLRYVELTRPEALAAMTANGVPEPVADAILDWSNADPARTGVVSDAVKNVTGRPARTFERWVTDNVEAFRR